MDAFTIAVANDVGVIRMEDLTEIRNRAKSMSEPGPPLLGVWSKANRKCKICEYTIHADLNKPIKIAKAISEFAT
jgi:hypothetical protein